MTFLRSPARTSRGQTLIEFALSMFLGITIVSIGLQFTYYAWAKVWIRHVLYETLICEMQVQSSCEKRARRLIDTFLPIQNANRPAEIWLSHRPFRYSGRIRVELNSWMYVQEGTTLDRPPSRTGGFVFLTFLVPLAVAILATFSLAALVMTEHAKHMQMCRQKVMEANHKIEDGIQRIIQLNPRILILQIQRDALEAAARSDPEPFSQAAIQAAIQKNQIQQMLMTNQQRLLKQAALNLSRLDIGILKTEATISGGMRFSSSRPRLILESETTWHTAKRQYRGMDFSDRHKIRVQWTVSSKKFDRVFKIPEYIYQSLNIACATHIRREGGQWMPMPTAM